MQILTIGSVFVAATIAVGVAQPQPNRTETGFLDRTVTIGGAPYRYQVYVPAEYAPEKPWPLLIDLHGGGAQGDDGIRQTAHFLADQIRLDRRRFPVLVVFPQAAPGRTWNAPAMQEMVFAEIENAMREFRADPQRVYLSGFSMGGSGVYEIASRWPDRFAAVVAISGAVPLDDSTFVKRLSHLPINIFHGASDERVPVAGARRLVADLKQAGAPVRYTEYPDTRHGPTAEKTYADPSVMDWLLSQRLGAPSNR